MDRTLILVHKCIKCKIYLFCCTANSDLDYYLFYILKDDDQCFDRQWNHNVALDGKLFLSRLRKNPDYVFIGLEIFGIIICMIALYYCYFHFEWFHYHVTGFYANLGHPHAQVKKVISIAATYLMLYKE